MSLQMKRDLFLESFLKRVTLLLTYLHFVQNGDETKEKVEEKKTDDWQERTEARI